MPYDLENSAPRARPRGPVPPEASQRALRGSPLARLLPVLLGGLLAACSRAPEPAAAPGCAVLITLDTTRWDAMGFLGAETGATPHLDALARESVVYPWARTSAPVTLPAHASMLTGLYPPRHTVRENHLMALPAEAETLAERARAAGLRTGAFVAAAVLDRAFGLDQGFEVYDQPERDADDPEANFAERPAARVVAAARRWRAGLADDANYFLWVHLFDPHAPYRPAEPFARRAPTPYLGEVAAMDAAVGDLLADLRARGDLDRGVVLVVADHGEALGDHGEPSHGTFVYDVTMRVPFLVRHPGARRGGARVAAAVSVADVYPTLVDALDLGPPGDVDGTSLYRGDPAPERGVYFESYEGYIKYGYAPLAGWADAGVKYVHGSRPELYAPQADPLEARDLAAERADEHERFRRALASQLARPPLEPAPALGADDELLRNLESLGYAASGTSTPELPSPLEPTQRPSPHARAAELEAFLAATSLGRRGRFAEAVRGLEEVVQSNPRHAAALDYMAFFLMQMQRHEEAAERLERALRLAPERPNTLYNLGVCRERAGRADEALQLYRRALALDPGHVGARRDAARLAGGD